MKNSTLAIWLEHCLEFIRQAEDPLSAVIFEGVLHAADTGHLIMLESILSGTAHSAVAVNRPLESLLNSIYITKMVIWGRLEAEIDPAQAWDMSVGLEILFQEALIIATDSYTKALAESHQRHAVEAARLSQEAEQKVMGYATELARANRELARLEQAKSDFISIAAHELKTPLTIVQGYADMLLEQELARVSEKAQTILKGIAVGAERMNDIVNDLLDVSAIEMSSLVLNPEPVVVGELFQVLLERASHVARSRQQTFNVDIKTDLPIIQTDPKRLYQVLDQLVNNAIKFTPDGGEITVTAYHETEAKTGADFIKVEVADTGIGIAPEDKEYVFDKFFRVGKTNLHSSGKVKFKGAGPGLGLSIVKGVVESLNGQIWIESQGYDEVNFPGSTFHLRLPVQKNSEE